MCGGDMFQRVPSISFMAVSTTALIFLLFVLFASSLSSPGTAHAQSPDLPEVRIIDTMPAIGEEGRYVRVTLKLSRALRADEKYCYRERTHDGNGDRNPTSEVCIEGGIIVWDTYDDHLYEEGGPKYDNGPVPSNELVKFVFRNDEEEKRLSVPVADDQCITPDRIIQISINTAFDDTDTYGYTIDDTEFEVPVNGDDEVNGTLVDNGGNCAPVDDGATEELLGNHAPLFSGSSPTRTVAENTAAGQAIGDPITASDPDEGDTLTYSLGGTDGASFDIDSSNGQLKTETVFNYEDQKRTYNVVVQVRDSKNPYGDRDTLNDDSIDVTVNVKDVNEPPDPPAAPTVNPKTGTTESLEVSWTAPNTEGKPDVTGYELQYRVRGADPPDWTLPTVPTADTTATITGLDSGTTYEVQVRASNDEGDSDWSPSGEGRTDNSVPTFDDVIPQGENSLTRTVPENSDAGENVGTPVAATDADSDELVYSLGGTDAAYFDIVSTSGQIQTRTSVNYDYETKPAYSVTVTADDGKGGTATIAVTISVTNLDEDGTITFSTDPPSVGTALTATLTDPDGGVTGETWEWESSPNGTDQWNTISGADTNSYTPVAADVGRYLQVTWKYTDSEGSDKSAKAETSSAVVVRPPTNENPSFADATATREVPENTAAGENIGAPVAAAHGDSKGTLVYSLGGTDAASFDLDTTTGQLKTKAGVDLDFETTPSYTVTVSVRDGLDDYSSADTVEDATVDVTINVTDVLETPTFNDGSSTTREVAENTTAAAGQLGSPIEGDGWGQ